MTQRAPFALPLLLLVCSCAVSPPAAKKPTLEGNLSSTGSNQVSNQAANRTVKPKTGSSPGTETHEPSSESPVSPLDEATAPDLNLTSQDKPGKLPPSAGDGPTEVTSVSLEQPPGTLPRLIPIFDDSDKLQSLMFRPSSSKITWPLRVAQGPSALTLSSVRLEIAVTATRQVSLTPPATATEPPAEAAAEPGAAASPATEVFQKSPKEVGLADSLKPGSQVSLVLELDGPDLFGVFSKVPDAKTLSLSLTLIGPNDAPIPDKYGHPLQLKADLTAL